MHGRRHAADERIRLPTARRRTALAQVFLSAVAASLMACTSDTRRGHDLRRRSTRSSSSVEGHSEPLLTIEGRATSPGVSRGDITYIQSRPFVEQLAIGNVTYTRYVDQDHWTKGLDAATPEGKALIAVRNALFDPSRSIGYLRSISTELTTEGKEQVRDDRTTHYRSIVDLGREGGPPGYTVSLDVWIDDSERTRRFRYAMLGDPESTVVWELYDFGVPVDITAPPSEKVR